MSLKKILITLFLSIGFVLNFHMSIFAMSTGFVTEEMSQDMKKTFLSNMHITTLESDQKKGMLSCFDVNKNGLIALGFSDHTYKMIYVYNTQGEFKYGYSFNDDGDFGIEWDNDNLLICLVRSNVVACYNREAKCLDIKRISDAVENNSYWQNKVFATKRTVGEDTYIMRNNLGFLNIFATSYSQIIEMNVNSEKNILYDNTANQRIKIIIVICGALIFFVIAVFVIISFTKKILNKSKS